MQLSIARRSPSDKLLIDPSRHKTVGVAADDNQYQITVVRLTRVFPSVILAIIEETTLAFGDALKLQSDSGYALNVSWVNKKKASD
jgi:hypothetical protein